MRAWIAGHGQPGPRPGYADSPANDPIPRRSDQIASGHPVTAEPPGGDPHDPGRVDVHDWNQQIRPARFASLATVSGCDGALASSIAAHQGRAVLGFTDERAAASPSLTSQLAAPPSGDPRQPAGHPAPSGAGERFGVTPARDPGPAYRTTPLVLQG
jgi:hypothetical protein